jgi:tetratricopeptide (TPR) repeat protein
VNKFRIVLGIAAVGFVVSTSACDCGSTADSAADSTTSATSPDVEGSKADTSTPASQTAIQWTGDTAAQITRLDKRIDFLRKRIQNDTAQWTDHADIGRAFMNRSRLTADDEDYRQAGAALDRAFELAPGKSGPLVSRMSFNQTVHRFDAVKDDLKALEDRPVTGQKPVAVLSVRSLLALQSGEVGEAIELLEQAYDQKPSASIAARLANLYFKTGELKRAAKMYDTATEKARPEPAMMRAWIDLQRGIFHLEQGQLDQALVAFEKADATFSGWYLIEEHIAEVLASTGKSQRAEKMYRDIVARVPNGEFLDALAGVVGDSGDTEQAKELRDRARQAHLAHLKNYPKAASGHTAEFFLVHGPVDRALELARTNWTNRQSPEARLLLIQALIRTGALETAQKHTDASVESKWDTADGHAIAARSLALSGQPERAERHRTRADELRTGASDDFKWLVPDSQNQ